MKIEKLSCNRVTRSILQGVKMTTFNVIGNIKISSSDLIVGLFEDVEKVAKLFHTVFRTIKPVLSPTQRNKLEARILDEFKVKKFDGGDVLRYYFGQSDVLPIEQVMYIDCHDDESNVLYDLLSELIFTEATSYGFPTLIEIPTTVGKITKRFKAGLEKTRYRRVRDSRGRVRLKKDT